jgi:hypothetical protein
MMRNWIRHRAGARLRLPWDLTRHLESEDEEYSGARVCVFARVDRMKPDCRRLYACGLITVHAGSFNQVD